MAWMAALLLIGLTPVIVNLAYAQQSSRAPTADEDGYVAYSARENPAGWNIPYAFTNDPADPAYAIALQKMAPTYKGKLGYNNRPLIGLAQVNLNRDPDVEMIAFPTEEEEEEGKFCNLNGLCPHYVIEVAGNKVNTLGVLYGWKVNRGDRVSNGYYTLKVYSLPEKSPESFEEYAYDPAAKEYRPVSP